MWVKFGKLFHIKDTEGDEGSINIKKKLRHVYEWEVARETENEYTRFSCYELGALFDQGLFVRFCILNLKRYPYSYTDIQWVDLVNNALDNVIEIEKPYKDMHLKSDDS